MTMQEAIETRRSRRKYVPEPLTASDENKLRELMGEINRGEALDIRLVVDNGAAFEGFRRSYGMFSGVRNYFALIGDMDDAPGVERLGYFGELLVLEATMLGLGSCWVGASFDRRACPFELARARRVICVISVGRVPAEPDGKERFIYGATHRKSKTPEEMYRSDGPVPDWFLRGMESVVRAPSALNRQPVMFEYKNGAVTASVKGKAGGMLALDLGIAKLHFKLGAGGGEWAFGNGGEFTRD